MNDDSQKQFEDFARLFTIPRHSAILLMKLVFENLFDIEVDGMDNIPLEGGGVIICNHTDFMDALIQGSYSPRKIIYLGKIELFEPDKDIKKFIYQEGSPLNNPLFAAMRPVIDQAIKTYAFAQRTQFLEWGGHPVVRNFRGNNAKAAVEYYKDLEQYIVNLLKDGKFLSIYPEGTRSHSQAEGLNPFKALAAKVAMVANVPIVPCAITGAHGFTSARNFFTGDVFNKSIKFKVGKAIEPKDFPKGDLKKTSKQLTKQLQSTVQSLLDDIQD